MDGDDRQAAKAVIDGSAAAERLFRPHMIGQRTERLCVAHLDGDYRLLGLRMHGSELPDRLALPTRAILRDAMVLETRKMIVAHNHPSGSAMPSRDDLLATRELAWVVHRAGIRLIDHLIFGRAVTSFRALKRL